MLFVDYDRIPSDSKNFVLKSVLSDSYVVKQVVKCSNRVLTFLATHGPENVPRWLYLKMFDDLAQCRIFLKLVDSHSCCPLGDSAVFYQKLRLSIEEIERKYSLVQKQFEGVKNV